MVLFVKISTWCCYIKVDKLINGVNKLGIQVTQTQLALFEKYYSELIDWNRKVNLTSILAYDNVQIKHFLDSLTILPLIERTHIKIIDVGSGAGFPGIPIKIVYPELSLTLLDSIGKKTAFLKHLCSVLHLQDTHIVSGRAEEVALKKDYREQFDVVVTRALARLSTAVELTIPFCILGGICIYQKKGEILSEINEAMYAISTLGGQIREIKSISLSELDDNRVLIIIEKVKSTPLNYPRRSGVPSHKPLDYPISKN
jgi:16S rRNA (guanine527-N7)-methyltransferase